MFFHAVSAYSQGSAAAAVSAAVGEASSAFSRDAKSVHVVISAVFKLGDGWKAIARVVVEPDLEERLEEYLEKAEIHYDAKDKQQELEDNLDLYDLEELDEMNPDLVMISPHLQGIEEIQDMSHNLSFSNPNVVTVEYSERLEAEFAVPRDVGENLPIHQLTPTPTYFDHDFELDVDAKHSTVDNNLESYQEKITPSEKQEPTQKNDLRPDAYVYFPYAYKDVYVDFKLGEPSVYSHLIENESMWKHVEDYFLDMKFYEATHLRELELLKGGVGGISYEYDMKSPEFKPKEKKLQHSLDLELDS